MTNEEYIAIWQTNSFDYLIILQRNWYNSTVCNTHQINMCDHPQCKMTEAFIYIFATN